jgi:hypothetical protein
MVCAVSFLLTVDVLGLLLIIGVGRERAGLE